MADPDGSPQEAAPVMEQALQSVFSFVSTSFKVVARDGITYLRTPFVDPDGDLVELAIEGRDGQIEVDDGGRLAGILFELDQESEGALGFQLVSSMIAAHQMEIDFDQGLVKKRLANEGTLGRELWIMAQTVAGLNQVLPFLRPQHRERPSLGPRLRRRVKSKMRDLNVLSLVEQRYRVPGMRVEEWTIDFYYRPLPSALADSHDVVINTVDLDVADPIPKAEHVITLAMDVKQRNPRSAIRVVYDTHGNNSESEQASQLIRGYQDDLKYEAFDYRVAEDNSRFSALLEQELFGGADSLWRQLRS